MIDDPQKDSKGNILVVDDTPENLHLMTILLKNKGYTVRPVPNGRLALSGAQGIPPDLILLDIRMPEMDGYEVCRQLKANERTCDIPVIFLSALDDVKDKVKGFSVGGIDFITKPFQEGEVLARVKIHLALRNSQKELEEKNTQLQQEIAERQRIELNLREYKNNLVALVSTRTKELKASNEQLHKLGAHQEGVREAERTRIAREIHDELGQVLTALKMDVAWLQKRLLEGDEQLLSKTKTMMELIGSTVKTVQKISRDLRPGLLDDLGLIAAVEWQTQEFQERTGVKCKLALDSDEQFELNNDLNTVVFRIFQEILTNITRHAQATNVKVSLTKQDDELQLTVLDNGIGITPEQIIHRDSFGLMGIRERLSPWNGSLKIEGIPAEGTTVFVVVPYSSNRK